ncbi:glyoxalase [Croceicoccus estronivorus]|uniref:VOC family protein n=1 Tax=Croceicoccus estronivorus TaxID=1172626 RepID=UPI0008356441|nr:VOC family protein [Croceicoccus estronivorus]OCC25137.1 glyoxalase [Croceicoccus estronivorus]
MDILGLGYVGLDVPDPEAWLAFGRDILGLDLGRAPGAGAYLPDDSGGRGADGSAYFRMDEWSWRLAVHPATGRPGVRYIGLEVAGPRELAAALAELEAGGFPARAGNAAECGARAVTGMGFTQDPSGNAIELFYGPLVTNGYRNSRGMTFLTGDMGMGHINLFVSRYEECADFYTRMLGFRLTDYYHVGPDQTVNFFHVNARHHTVGIMKVADVDAVHHLMFETTELDMVGEALDRVMAAGCKITASLGRHSNDRIVSFYVASPSGVEIEIGWGAIKVGPDWTPRYRGPGDIWGHHGLTAENIEETGRRV